MDRLWCDVCTSDCAELALLFSSSEIHYTSDYSIELDILEDGQLNDRCAAVFNSIAAVSIVVDLRKSHKSPLR